MNNKESNNKESDNKKSLIPDNFKIPELLTSLVYGSGISSMLSYIATINNKSFISIINTILILTLVFVDLNNRVFIPLHFPSKNDDNADNNDDTTNNDKANTINEQTLWNRLWDTFWNEKFVKLFLEITGMVLLILFFNKFYKNEFSNSDNFNIYTIFSIYLIFTGAWNLNILNFMGVKIRSAISKLFGGIIIEIESLKEITTNLQKKMKSLEENLHKEIEKNGVSTAVKHYNIELFKLNSYKLIPQIIGNHVVWFNLFIAVILLNFYFSLVKINPIIHISSTSLNIISVLWLIFIFSIILLLLTMITDLSKNYQKTIFSLSTIFIMLSLYLLIYFYSETINSFFYVAIIQQIVIGFLIEKITDGKFFS